MRPYENDAPVGQKYPEKIIANRKKKYTDPETREEFQSVISRHFRTWEIRRYSDLLERLQEKIDLLVPMLGNFDPATEVYKEPPEGLKSIHKLIGETYANESVHWNADPLKRRDWQKFEVIATYFYNVNDIVDDNGDVLIDEIADLCLEGVQKAFERQGK